MMCKLSAHSLGVGLYRHYLLHVSFQMDFLSKREGPFSNSSVGRGSFIPMVGAICFGSKLFLSIGKVKLPSYTDRLCNILHTRNGKQLYCFSSLTTSAWNFCDLLEYFRWPCCFPSLVSFGLRFRCILCSMAAIITRMMKYGYLVVSDQTLHQVIN